MKQKDIDKILNSFKPPKVEILLEEVEFLMCKKCNEPLYEDEEYMVCRNCNKITPLMFVPSLEQIQDVYNYSKRKFQYSRLNNFRYVLSRFQCKEDNKIITFEVIEQLKTKIKEDSKNFKNLRNNENLKNIDNLKIFIEPYLMKSEVIKQLNKLNNLQSYKTLKKGGNIKISEKLNLLINKKSNDELKEIINEIKSLVIKYPYKNGIIEIIKKIKNNSIKLSFNRLIIKWVEEITGKKQMKRHLFYIRNALGYDKTNYLTLQQEEEVMRVFILIDRSINKYIPDYRKNSLNSKYLMYNIFKLLGFNNFLSKIKVITTQNTLSLYSSIWEKLCEEHNFKLLPYP